MRETARIPILDMPAQSDVLVLRRSGDIFEIRCNGWELMSSRAHHSEDVAGRLACAAIADRAHPRVLIGGLGMGFTLRSALDVLPMTADVVVAELFESVVAWNRGDLAKLAGAPLEDARVRLVRGDVAALIGAAGTQGADGFDAIVLDVDNGPASVMLARNAALYGDHGLAELHRALRPGGVVSVWGADPDAAFAARLGAAGFAVTRHDVPARDDPAAPLHTVYVGRRV